LGTSPTRQEDDHVLPVDRVVAVELGPGAGRIVLGRADAGQAGLEESVVGLIDVAVVPDAVVVVVRVTRVEDSVEIGVGFAVVGPGVVVTVGAGAGGGQG